MKTERKKYLRFIWGYIIHITVCPYVFPDAIQCIEITYKLQGSTALFIRTSGEGKSQNYCTRKDLWLSFKRTEHWKQWQDKCRS